MKKIIFLFLFSTISLFSQDEKNLNTKYKTYKDTVYNGMSYGFYKPKDYNSSKKFPLVIYLHGNKDVKSHDLHWYKDYFQNNAPCFVLTPKSLGSPPYGAWGNNLMENLTDDFKKAMQIIDYTIDNYNVDKNRVYIYGISMGGSAVHLALSKYPDKFAAAYIVSGYGDPEKATKYAHVPLWIFHGSEDEVTPAIFPRKIFNKIKNNPNHKTRYTEYNCIGHDSWINVNQENNLHEWLFKQSKNNNAKRPQKISIINYDVGDRFWKHHLSWKNPYYFETAKNKILYYNVYKNGKLIAQTDELEYLDIDTTTQKTTYYVTAVNYYSKESKPSKTIIANK